jgi:hypothetical protein
MKECSKCENAKIRKGTGITYEAYRSGVQCMHTYVAAGAFFIGFGTAVTAHDFA